MSAPNARLLEVLGDLSRPELRAARAELAREILAVATAGSPGLRPALLDCDAFVTEASLAHASATDAAATGLIYLPRGKARPGNGVIAFVHLADEAYVPDVADERLSEALRAVSVEPGEALALAELDELTARHTMRAELARIARNAAALVDAPGAHAQVQAQIMRPAFRARSAGGDLEAARRRAERARAAVAASIASRV